MVMENVYALLKKMNIIQVTHQNDTFLGVFRVNFDTELVESSENTNEYKLRMLRENHHGNQKAGRELYSVLAIWHYSNMSSLSGPTEKLQNSQILMPVEKMSTMLQHFIWGSHILMSLFAIGYLRKTIRDRL